MKTEEVDVRASSVHYKKNLVGTSNNIWAVRGVARS
jgi:hypothetical protein